MKIALDTNVLISASFWKGDSYKILQLIDKNLLSLVLSPAILEEYYKVLHSVEISDKITENKLNLDLLATKVLLHTEIVYPKQKINAIPDDPDDDKIIECAVEGKVDYIITQDNHLLKLDHFNQIKILKPGELLGIMEEKAGLK